MAFWEVYLVSIKLSVVMLVYNELATLQQVIDRAPVTPFDLESLCVDDGSTDVSRDLLVSMETEVEEFEFRCSRGICSARGIHEATRDFVLIQDADIN